ncbi:pilin [Candidatus Parcubacteria bacterium]|nr:pilin [Candidatus Parcubacteria bacterium]
MSSDFKFLKKASLPTILASLILPLTTFAADPFPMLKPPKNLTLNVINIIVAFFNIFWPIVVTIIIVMLMWSGIMFLTAAGDPAKISTAKKAILWAIIGVVIIVLSYSIISIINNFFVPPAP